ncbi:hypothetical protein AB0L34_27870 [Micromonospora sp. NPDC052213]
MGGVRAGLTVDQLRPVVRAACGRGRELWSAERLTGGTKKGVYRTLAQLA